MTSLAVSYQVAGDAYQGQAVGTAGPLQLVPMLYDRALAAIAQSEWALRHKERDSIELAHKELARAQDIVAELMLSLDRDKGGEISSSLNAIYEFCLDRLTHANLNKDATALPFVAKSLTDLREAWAHIAAETGE